MSTRYFFLTETEFRVIQKDVYLITSNSYDVKAYHLSTNSKNANQIAKAKETK